MGVVNATPDSFHAVSRTEARDAAVARALRLVDEGADVLDLGGESTRPGAAPVAADAESARVVPVLDGLRGRVTVPISIDTYKASVARAAVAAGASIVNDVSGGLLDPAMPETVAQLGVVAIVGHLRGTPATMRERARYADVVREVAGELAERVATFRAAGVAAEKLWIDPGFGFAKNHEHNLALLDGLGEIAGLGQPVVVGLSRKRFLGDILRGQGLGGEDTDDRLEASLAAATLAAARGAILVRTHDVAPTRRAIALVDALRGSREGI
ncbi:MAG: dihydropteroate synthase [Deltaproteobacteria bacterium]|nr:dihydropteroate synthase [Deltaproteobacteria bacterium]